jgi:hypothetical protein
VIDLRVDRPSCWTWNDSGRVARFGLTAGTSLVWQSGTPLNEFGGHPGGPPSRTFLRPRGTAGRTPPIADVDLRLAYAVRGVTASSIQPSVILDVFHIGSGASPWRSSKSITCGPTRRAGSSRPILPTVRRHGIRPRRLPG